MHRAACCGSLEAGKQTLVPLYWPFAVPDFIYGIAFISMVFPGLKDLFSLLSCT